jgi:hypothetical protein
MSRERPKHATNPRYGSDRYHRRIRRNHGSVRDFSDTPEQLLTSQ